MSDVPMKRCNNPNCKQWYPATAEFFHRHKSGKYGLSGQCKACRSKKVLTWQKTYCKRPEVKKRIQTRMSAYFKQQEVQERVSARMSAYNSRPEVKVQNRIRSRTRDARKMAVPGSHTPKQSREQYDRQKGKCYWCQQKLTWGKHHEDHIIPLTREGSSNDISNIVIACPHCNTSKNNKYPHEFFEGGKLL